MIDNNILLKFKKKFSKTKILTSHEERLNYAYDASKRNSIPDLVAFAEDTLQVSDIVKWCGENNFSIVARGAGTGQTGGAVPANNGLVLSMENFNKVLKVDEENYTILTEPGASIKDIRLALKNTNLFFPPDPGGLKVSTIGGAAAENAGGPRAVKYGVTDHYILGLEAVLMDNGKIIQTGELAQYSSDYDIDLTDLFIGSEGTLGIITKLLLKAVPKFEHNALIMLLFSNYHSAVNLAFKLHHHFIHPSVLELIDESSLKLTAKHVKIPINSKAKFGLFIELEENNEDELRKQIRKIEDLSKKLNSSHTIPEFSDTLQVLTAHSEKDKDNLWQLRRSISPALAQLGLRKVNEDICLPKTNVGKYLEFLEDLSTEKQIKIVTFGHLGDGNLHVNMMLNDYQYNNMKSDLIERIFLKAIELDGVISGEHGIGLTKKEYIKLQLNNIGHNYNKEIKKLFDPNFLLNPSKIFI